MTNTSEVHSDDQAIIEAGYRPELRRNLRFFASFAVAFSCMSILMGVFANYGYVLTKAGPFGFWTWLLVGAGQTLVALVFAEMAGRIPLTGAIYNWNTRLANPFIGWLSAWLLAFTYTIGAVAVIAAMMPPLQTFFGHEFNATTSRFIGVGIFVVQALINIYGVRFAAQTNRLAVIAEIIALFVFGGIILGLILIKGQAHTGLLTMVPNEPGSYWQSFLMASLLAAWTIFGFETPSDLSEETLNVRHVTPKSIIASVVIVTLLGFAFVVILTLAIPDLAAVTAASDPISTIVTYHLGEMPTKIFLIVVLVAMFATSLVAMTAASRLLFAVARDKRLIGSSFLARVSSHRVPAMTICVVTISEILVFLLFQNITDLYATPVILLTLVYLTTVISYAAGFKKLPTTSYFSLGAWRWPVVTLAILWLVSEISILTIPTEFHSAALITGSIVLVGIILRLIAEFAPRFTKPA